MFGFGKKLPDLSEFTYVPKYEYIQISKAVDVTDVEQLNKLFEEGYSFYNLISGNIAIVGKTEKKEITNG